MFNAKDVMAALESAVSALRSGQPESARQTLAPLVGPAGHLPDVHYFLGMALERCGDPLGAEISYRKAVGLEQGRSRALIALGDLFTRQRRHREAEAEYRAAQKRDPGWQAAAVGLSDSLVAQGRLTEALAVTAPFINRPDTSESLLAARAAALKASGELEAALQLNRRATQAFPASAISEHNLASTLGDLARHAEAEAAIDRAFAKGIDAPESWVVRAHAMQGLGRLDEAEAGYIQALQRRPAMAEAHSELAQLIWMRTGDRERTLAIVDDELQRTGNPELARVKAKALSFIGDLRGAHDALQSALKQAPGDILLLDAAAQAAIAVGESGTALDLARRAGSLGPTNARVQLTLAQALIATGDATLASLQLEQLRGRHPNDQLAIALQATCWRILGDPRYAALYDYDGVVGVQRVETPRGWSDLPSYLADLARELRACHWFATHPFGQSLRGGSQATDLLVSTNEVIAALPGILTPCIDRYIASLGAGDDPLRRRRSSGHRFAGMWSVLLHPHGHHVQHIHQLGWLSSAFYVESVSRSEADDPGRQGWFKLGEPGTATPEPLPPERFVKPEPGMLVLFPSYMWHGTVPFDSGERLSVAFDVVPV